MPLSLSVVLADGSKFPLVGYGTANMLEQDVYAALQAGARHLDCAALYGNEDLVGNALHRYIQEYNDVLIKGDDPTNRNRPRSPLTRADFFLTSKVPPQAHRPGHLRETVLTTLKDLRVEYLDLLLLHWPYPMVPGKPFVRDESMSDFAQTWRAMERLV